MIFKQKTSQGVFSFLNNSTDYDDAFKQVEIQLRSQYSFAQITSQFHEYIKLICEGTLNQYFIEYPKKDISSDEKRILGQRKEELRTKCKQLNGLMAMQGMLKNMNKIEIIKLFATFLSKQILQRCRYRVQDQVVYELLIFFLQAKRVSKKCYFVNLAKYMPVNKKKKNIAVDMPSPQRSSSIFIDEEALPKQNPKRTLKLLNSSIKSSPASRRSKAISQKKMPPIQKTHQLIHSVKKVLNGKKIKVEKINSSSESIDLSSQQMFKKKNLFTECKSQYSNFTHTHSEVSFMRSQRQNFDDDSTQKSVVFCRESQNLIYVEGQTNENKKLSNLEGHLMNFLKKNGKKNGGKNQKGPIKKIQEDEWNFHKKQQGILKVNKIWLPNLQKLDDQSSDSEDGQGEKGLKKQGRKICFNLNI